MIDWNLSGAIVHRDLILPFADGLRMPEVCLRVHDGFPGLAWCGGRDRGGTLDPEVLDDVVEQYRRRGIGFNLLFSNHLLTRDDLSNEYGNMLLAKLHEERNGVVVCDGVLADYVRANYPKYRLIRSVIQSYLDRVIDRSPAAIVHYFQDKTQKYDRVVVPSELNLRFDILDKLDKSKLEFLVNNGCYWHCPMRVQHYESIARGLKSPEGSSGNAACLTEQGLRSPRRETLLKYLLQHEAVIDSAGARLKRIRPGQRYVVGKSVSTCEEVSAMVRKGCTHFKLQGRDVVGEHFALFLKYYVVAYDLDPA